MPHYRNDAPDPVDVFVGQAIRAKRIRLGLTQSDLGRSVGVTFQQVQKYEKGTNRVSASVLMKCATALGCYPADFFPGEEGVAAPAPSMAMLPDGAKLEAIFLALSPRERRALIVAAEAMTTKGS